MDNSSIDFKFACIEDMSEQFRSCNTVRHIFFFGGKYYLFKRFLFTARKRLKQMHPYLCEKNFTSYKFENSIALKNEKKRRQSLNVPN